MKSICPVCNKAGLPDYTLMPTICPQCNSDLKPFLLLNLISKEKIKYRLIFVISLLSIILIFTVIYYISDNRRNREAIINAEAISKFQDSIKLLKYKIENNQTLLLEKVNRDGEIIIRYKVKKKDYPAMIADFFYNDWKMYKKIEKDNNLKQPYELKVGQILIIKLKQ